MLSLQSINVFVDPTLKQVDSEIFNKVKFFTISKSYNLSTSLNFSSDESFPQLVFYSDNNLCLPRGQSSGDNNFYVKVLSSNLDMFSKLEAENDEFSITTVSEIEMSFDLFESVFNKFVFVNRKLILKNTFKNLMNLKKNINMDLLTDSQSVELIEFERSLYSVNTIDDISLIIEESSTKIFKTKLSIKMENEITSNDLSNILELKASSTDIFFINFNSESAQKEIVFALYLSVLERIKLIGSVLSNSAELDTWQGLLNTVDFPIVLFNENSQLVIHNQYFPSLKLSSQVCYTYDHNHEVSLFGVKYRIIRTHFLGGELFFFIPKKEKDNHSDKPSSEELGIVSSSIAHELNNPLAGIMAALDVLLLDDYDDEEIVEKFIEMKSGVTRCKKLVETFLGFSQVKSSRFKSPDVEVINDSVTQAIELLRFRIIENNIKFDYSFISQGNFLGVCNQHILTMTFYLILGELLTSNSHQKLIENTKNNSLELKIVESINMIVFESDSKINISSDFWSSKLFNHLLVSEKLKVTLTEQAAKITLL
jgi:hypothetical protein